MKNTLQAAFRTDFSIEALPATTHANAETQTRAPGRAPNSETAPPLVVDLDGTLTTTDTLVEGALRLLKREPWMLLHMLAWLLAGRAIFKERIAERSAFEPANMPWREDFLAWLRAQHATGRTLILATAAHQSIAERVAAHFGLFSCVLATSAGKNLKGHHKLEAILAHTGPRFSYAGDSRADLAIWRSASTAVVVGASAKVSAAAHRLTIVEAEFSNAPVGWRVWIRALRVHQWAKNLLVFVPAFTAFQFSTTTVLVDAATAFLAFSLVASATYIFNDLWDLDSDRHHPRKCTRPFASGAIPLTRGIMAAALCAAAGIGIAAWLSSAVVLLILGYVVATTWYSMALKHYVVIDVLVLALLYTLRVFMGSVATGIVVTSWLLSFSVFMFFSLALIKRCAELRSLERMGQKAAKGRDYQPQDLVVLWPLGIGASLCAVVVFGLYIGAPETAAHYGSTTPLWFAGVGLIYWTARLWIKTARGEMHDDPLVFALRDFGSRLTICGMLGLMVVAHALD